MTERSVLRLGIGAFAIAVFMLIPILNLMMPPGHPLHLSAFWVTLLGKVGVLVLIILFIQRRPQGLFALRGRAAEAAT